MTEAEKMASKQNQHVRSLIEDHFRLRISPDEEQRLRTHLPACASCRRHYNKHLLVAGIDPAGAPAFERLAVGLGVRARRPRPAALYMGSLAAVAAGLLLVLIVVPERDRETAMAHRAATQDETANDDPALHGLTARGAGRQRAADLFVYRVRGSDIQALADDETVAPDDELAFAYLNPSGHKHMLVFAVDEERNVHWYFPAWQNADETPVAMAIAATSEPRRLSDAIRQPLRGTRAEIFAIFTDQPLTVRAIESWLANPGSARAKLEESLRTDPSAVVRARVLRLQPR